MGRISERAVPVNTLAFKIPRFAACIGVPNSLVGCGTQFYGRGMAYRIALILLPLLCATACARVVDGEVPSLAKRAYELTPEQIAALANAPLELQDGDSGERAGPAPVLPPATAERMNTALGQHQSGSAAFARELPAARSAIAAGRGAAVGSENWVVAQMALTRLDSARAPSVAALGALDALHAETVSALGINNARRIDEARAQVARDVVEQNRVVAELGAQLRY